jgi:hypothetical protein
VSILSRRAAQTPAPAKREEETPSGISKEEIARLFDGKACSPSSNLVFPNTNKENQFAQILAAQQAPRQTPSGSGQHPTKTAASQPMSAETCMRTSPSRPPTLRTSEWGNRLGALSLTLFLQLPLTQSSTNPARRRRRVGTGLMMASASFRLRPASTCMGIPRLA